ncbi:hypothetical protein CSOJ01_11955 [Colletotrichum sojae]|uniref:Uncharacterized protein n=1 Tax=Colletotrichum sojae TaxID=2175907 RepID=A0A8H6MMZ9_9PEZI|nr:hypothetical protein CSOJ01_11955 [Colletotrichum sojae]
MDKHVEAAPFTPRAVHHDASTSSHEESSAPPSSCLPYRKGSMTMFPVSPAPFRTTPQRGRTTPANNITLNTKVRPVWSVFTSPGSFEQLYNERAYLAASLRSQGERSIDLMRRLSTMQDKIDHGLPPDERRKSRKKAALLKSKISEATAQEKAIMLRLGDISQELNIRERWMQVQHEMYERNYRWWVVESPNTAFLASPSEYASVISTPMDMVSPVYFPVGYYPVYGSLEMTPIQEPEGYALEGMPPPPESWADDGVYEGTVDVLGNHGLQFFYDARDQPDRTARRLCDDNSGADVPPRKLSRRMSLPALRSLWPGQDA